MVKGYIFDSEKEDFVPNPELTVKEPLRSIGDPETTGSDVILEILDDNINAQPGGIGFETLQPPDTFYIAEQILRNNPDGSTTVDIVVEIEDTVPGQYEVRVTR